MLTYLALAILIAPQWGAAPQFAYCTIYLSDNLSGDYLCNRTLDILPELRQFYVLVSTPGAQGAEFSAPLPSCLDGATYLSDELVFPVTIGNSQTGISMSFGACRSGDAIHILTINFLMNGITGHCCPYEVLPNPNSNPPGQILFVDCMDNLLPGSSGAFFFVRTPGTILQDPSPSDGAINQSLSVRLTWTERRCDCCLCATMADVYFGTTTDPPLVSRLGNGGPGDYPYDPGPLEPNTTYYWKVLSYGADVPWMSPLWSFTTGVGVPTNSTSWGAIKALFTE